MCCRSVRILAERLSTENSLQMKISAGSLDALVKIQRDVLVFLLVDVDLCIEGSDRLRIQRGADGIENLCNLRIRCSCTRKEEI